MPTFIELQQQLKLSTAKKAVLQYVIDHLDASFKSIAGAPPKSILKMDDGNPVPPEAFEVVITDILLKNIEEIGKSTEEITHSTLQPQQPVQPQPAEEQISEHGDTGSTAAGPVAAPAPVPFVPAGGDGAAPVDPPSSGGGRRRSQRAASTG